MQFTIRAYNSNGVELSLPTEPGRYGQPGETVSDARYFVATWKTGYRVNLSDGSSADYDAPVRYTRNRVAYFKVTQSLGPMIGRFDRDRSNGEADVTVRVADAIEAAIEAQSDAPAVSAAPSPVSAPGPAPAVSEADSGSADGFEPNPYWGDLDSVNGVYVTHADTGTRGVALYGGDGTGRADGQLIEFFEAPTGDTYGALQRAGYDEGRATIVNHSAALTVSAQEWDWLADETNWPATSGKFQNGLAERLDDSSEWADDTMGDVEGFGHFALFKSDRAMLQTDNFGFVGVTRFDTEALTQTAWESLARDYERFCLAGLEDALPTGECDEVFLIFDTARHVNSVPDRDEIREHVHQCRICLPYRYTLDEFWCSAGTIEGKRS